MPRFEGVTAAPSTESATRALLAAQLEELELLTSQHFESVAAPASVIELRVSELGWDDLVWRARLIVADVAGRRGDTTGQGRVAIQANVWAQEHGDEFVLARSHRLLASFFRRLGDYPEALTHAIAGVKHADGMSDRLRCTQLMSLALQLDANGRFDDARTRSLEAMRIAEDHDDDDQIVTILNNMAFTAYVREDAEEADRLAQQMLTFAAARDLTLDGLSLHTLASIFLLRGKYEQAEDMLQPILDDPEGPLVSEGDTLPECLLTLADVYAHTDRHIEVGETLDVAGALCDERGLASVAARVHRARAEWHATAGRFRQAYEEYRIFHSCSEALHSAEREARAYAMQAVFETAEARKISQHFQEMAHRDALTGLFNRRHVDETLAEMVAAARRTHEPLSLAIIDLDHFKRVNDTLSHAVGDQVLRHLGELLDEFAAAPECPARLGGEEFVLLLPGTAADLARERCEALAEAVRATDWTPMTGGLPITVSIGVTTHVEGPITPATLLAAADDRLYAAKRGGRNRVISDPTGTSASGPRPQAAGTASPEASTAHSVRMLTTRPPLPRSMTPAKE